MKIPLMGSSLSSPVTRRLSFGAPWRRRVRRAGPPRPHSIPERSKTHAPQKKHMRFRPLGVGQRGIAGRLLARGLGYFSSAAFFAAFALRVSAAFLAAAERAGSTAFFAVLFFAAGFVAVFLAVVDFALEAAVFFAAVLRVGAFFFAGPLARLMASNSTARSKVMSSTLSPRGIVALVSPSVTYGPKRPSRTLTGLPLTGSASNSLRAL